MTDSGRSAVMLRSRLLCGSLCLIRSHAFSWRPFIFTIAHEPRNLCPRSVNETLTKQIADFVQSVVSAMGVEMTVTIEDSPEATRINLAWNDNAADETGHTIERCTGNSCSNFVQIGTAAANVRAFADTTTTKNTHYRYRVRAYNGTGNSAYSNIATERTPSCAS